MHSRTVHGGSVRPGQLEMDPLNIYQPFLCPSHYKLLVILSILQSQAADNQLVFVHHQAFHNYFVFFSISQSVLISRVTTITNLTYPCEIFATAAQI